MKVLQACRSTSSDVNPALGRDEVLARTPLRGVWTLAEGLGLPLNDAESQDLPRPGSAANGRRTSPSSYDG